MNWEQEMIEGQKEDLKVTIDYSRDRITDLKASKENAETELEKAKEAVGAYSGLIKQKEKELEKAIEKLAELNQESKL